ncbi:MAG TPA: PTS sugar transporter subunit IIA [Eubacteriaceae bacterium]|jgi:PTS system galactitol-specific IIA component|nr:PTS sugar transporter subunit IIA [Eubacteriaceae bacterium]
MIYEELIQLDMEAKDSEEFFQKMAEELKSKGFVEDSFLEAIKKREKDFPTALPIEPYSVAIPHTDPMHIKRPFIAAARLKAPVKWNEMGNDEVEHDVRFIFMLGFNRSNEHIQLLQMLIENFQKTELMNKFLTAETEKEYMNLILSMEGFDTEPKSQAN